MSHKLKKKTLIRQLNRAVMFIYNVPLHGLHERISLQFSVSFKNKMRRHIFTEYIWDHVEEFYLNSRLGFVCRRYNNSLMVWKWSGFMGCHDIWLWLRCIVAPIVLGGRRVTYLTAIYFDFVNVSVKNAHAFYHKFMSLFTLFLLYF